MLMLEQLRQQLRRLRHKLQSPTVRIWACLFGGTLVWALHLMTIYPLTSLTCRWGWFAAPAEGTGLKLIQTLTTLVALGLSALFGFVAYKVWQHARTAGSHEAGETLAARIPMLAFVTLLLNSLYLLIILVMLAPIFVLSACR
jgi:hypothetical protein